MFYREKFLVVKERGVEAEVEMQEQEQGEQEEQEQKQEQEQEYLWMEYQEGKLGVFRLVLDCKLLHHRQALGPYDSLHRPARTRTDSQRHFATTRCGDLETFRLDAMVFPRV